VSSFEGFFKLRKTRRFARVQRRSPVRGAFVLKKPSSKRPSGIPRTHNARAHLALAGGGPLILRSIAVSLWISRFLEQTRLPRGAPRHDYR
jgi:hypothetical protein